MSLIAVLGHYDVHPEDAKTVGDLMRVMMTETQKEEGCVHYAFAIDLTSPSRFQLSELWESVETLAAHGKTAHMAIFRAGLAEHRIQQRSVTRYHVSEPAPL